MTKNLKKTRHFKEIKTNVVLKLDCSPEHIFISYYKVNKNRMKQKSTHYLKNIW